MMLTLAATILIGLTFSEVPQPVEPASADAMHWIVTAIDGRQWHSDAPTTPTATTIEFHGVPGTAEPTAGAAESDAVPQAVTLKLDELESINPVRTRREPAKAAQLELLLRNGTQLHADFGASIAQPVAGDQMRSFVTTRCGDATIPADMIASIRLAGISAKAATEFDSRFSSADATRDQLVVDSGDRVTTLLGACERLNRTGWEFRVGGRPLKGDYSTVAGIIFAQGLTPRGMLRPDVTISLIDGQTIVGCLRTMTSEHVTVAFAKDHALSTEWSDIANIAYRSANVEPLSKLKPSVVTSSGYFGNRWTWQSDRATTGEKFVMGGKSFRSGIGVHSMTQMTYSIPDGFTHFTAIIGLQDVDFPKGCASVTIKLDEKTVFERPTIKTGDAPDVVSIELGTAKTLTLEVGLGDATDLGDHVNFADARFVRTGE